jgi:hypothetical protein
MTKAEKKYKNRVKMAKATRKFNQQKKIHLKHT